MKKKSPYLWDGLALQKDWVNLIPNFLYELAPYADKNNLHALFCKLDHFKVAQKNVCNYETIYVAKMWIKVDSKEVLYDSFRADSDSFESSNYKLLNFTQIWENLLLNFFIGCTLHAHPTKTTEEMYWFRL